MPSNTTTTVHKDFSADGTDVIIRSSDNVLFNLHRANLASTTGAFPGTEISTNGEHVPLSEPADVLEMLFQFIYPKRHPTLKGLNFAMVLRVAEAAEKYEVFPALHTCEMRLRENIREHPFEVLVHAIKHDYQDLVNESSLVLILKPIVPIAERLPLDLIIPWVKYREAWRSVFERTINLIVINPTLNYSYCLVENSSGGRRALFCLACSHAIKAWINELTRIEDVDILNSTIQAYTGDLQRQECSTVQCTMHGNLRCMHIGWIQASLLESLKAISPFTSFLRAIPAAS